jgi:hypothetical protein
MAKNALYVPILLFCLSALAGSCGKSGDIYDVNTYFSQAAQDTIMANIITYIYKVPRGVRKENKHQPEYRHLYVQQIPEFDFVHYFIDHDSTHYFYLIRPARNVQSHKRGAAGKYKIGPNLELLHFQEIFNTPMLPVEEIREKGKYLWADLMHFKHVDRYFLNKDYIEFPDERARYDTTLKEWTYTKEQ